ncbi:hypothetical protein NONO_c68250 [Nocardia nova SH22a]|uniref:Uncharacterized protein n=1 Tax=Nocardia nova SH22a TaxID=1415166 RepID=W5TQR7_9NOCA|nr:hypothetical protein [Nocardia nova]AHH21592.1 hypothetical protein NONO_c68250 [Nocardia nova SH22a]
MAGRHSAASGQWYKRGGSLLVIGALPLSMALWQSASAGAAAPEAPAAQPGLAPLDDAVATATQVLSAPNPLDAAAQALAHAAPSAPWQFRPAAATDTAVAPIADAAPAAGPATEAAAATSGRNIVNGTRAVPDLAAPAPVDPGALHLPDLGHMAPAVAPIKAPDNTIRIGSVQTARPDFLDPQLTAQINDSAAQTEAGLAQGLDSAGFEPSRSDRIAADTLGGAVIGSSVGNIVSSPIASTSALVGGVAGLIAGIPFLPAGLVVMPVVGAAIGYAVIAAPAAAAGAAIGAGIGAIEGASVPGVAPQPTAPAAV